MSGSAPNFRLPLWDHTSDMLANHFETTMLALVVPLMLLLVAVRRGTGILAALLLLVVFVASF